MCLNYCLSLVFGCVICFNFLNSFCLREVRTLSALFMMLLYVASQKRSACII